jgi:hypothetical protein
VPIGVGPAPAGPAGGEYAGGGFEPLALPKSGVVESDLVGLLGVSSVTIMAEGMKERGLSRF